MTVEGGAQKAQGIRYKVEKAQGSRRKAQGVRLKVEAGGRKIIERHFALNLQSTI